MRCQPLHPASRRSLVAGVILGPLLWLLLLAVAAWVFDYTWAIGVGLLWTSNRWIAIWKLIGTLTWPIGYAAALFLDVFFQAPIWLSLLADSVTTIGLLTALALNARAPRQVS